MDERDLKTLTARSMKWNVIDRLLTQVVYAVVGIVLANNVSQEEFGLVGAIVIFQAFASLFVDSGFAYALIQRQSPSRLDYSSVLWFNVVMALLLYAILWFAAPLIADFYHGDTRLVPLSRVTFLSFIFSAAAIVQTNRLMKQMDVRPIAVTNFIGVASGGIVGVWLAVRGYGAWAIVWQNVTLTAVKCVAIWIWTRWVPLFRFSLASLKSFCRVGSSMMATSFLNTLFQNIYSALIGRWVGLVPLGYYTQADKWSKMGITSITQAMTSSFLPSLSEVQDSPERFARAAAKMNRCCAYLVFPAMGFLILVAEPLFHVLFGNKWDASIVLFQLLLFRGVFTTLTSLYNNYIIALGRSRYIVAMELLRDVTAAVALVATFPFISLSSGSDIVLGIRILLWGQIGASALTWAVTMIITAPMTYRTVAAYLADCLPYLAMTAVIAVATGLLASVIHSPLVLLITEVTVALGAYVAINALLGSRIQRDALSYLRRGKS